MKMPKPKLLVRQTKEDKEKAKFMAELMSHYWTEEDQQRALKQFDIMKKEYEANPLGLCFVYWDKNEKK